MNKIREKEYPRKECDSELISEIERLVAMNDKLIRENERLTKELYEARK